ncbi:MAG: putative toxin-antitoxin system toxin component, PIN family [Acidobacteriota bacterium]
MTDRPRAVLDTNIFVSALLSRNPSSPTQELIRRWESGEFTLLVSDTLIDELTDKLLEKRVTEERVTELLGLLIRLAEWVEVPSGSVEAVVKEDADDDAVLACAVIGRAGFLVTYDAHFDAVGPAHQGVRIMKAIPFLRVLRGNE